MARNRGLTGICVALVFTILGACGGGGGSDNSAGGGSSGGNNANGTPPSNNSPNVPPSSNDPNAPVAVGAFAYVTNEDRISAFSIDETTGALSEIPGSPFFAGERSGIAVITPSGKFAYGGTSGSDTVIISTYAIDATTGALSRVGDPVDLGRVTVISVTMHPSGRAIFLSLRRDYADFGSTVVPQIVGFAIDAATGSLTRIGSTQLAAEPQRLIINPAGTFAYVWEYDENARKGFIATYAINTTDGSLSETADSPMETRNVYQFAFAPSGVRIYAAVWDPDANDALMIGYAVDATTGALSEMPGSPFGQSDRVYVHPSGKFVYGGEPGNDAMNWASMTFAVNESTGALTRVGANGEVGLYLTFSPSAKFVYGASDRSLYVNAIDPDTGMLTTTGTMTFGSFPAVVTTATYR
jgi:6-phosphogluconolactonase (cycloisomerase 2 family)